MAGVCSICGKKYSWIFQDYPLSEEFPETRICANCYEKIDILYKSNEPEKETEIICELETYLKTSPYPEVREFLTQVLYYATHKEQCDAENQHREAERQQREAERQQREEERLRREVQQFEEQAQTLLLTTGNSFDGYKVEKYIDVVCLEGKFLLDSLTLPAIAWEDLMKKFRAKAVRMGANAVLGIDFENSFSAGILLVSVSGTAVKVKKIEE